MQEQDGRPLPGMGMAQAHAVDAGVIAANDGPGGAASN